MFSSIRADTLPRAVEAFVTDPGARDRAGLVMSDAATAVVPR